MSLTYEECMLPTSVLSCCIQRFFRSSILVMNAVKKTNTYGYVLDNRNKLNHLQAELVDTDPENDKSLW